MSFIHKRYSCNNNAEKKERKKGMNGKYNRTGFELRNLFKEKKKKSRLVNCHFKARSPVLRS